MDSFRSFLLMILIIAALPSTSRAESGDQPTSDIQTVDGVPALFATPIMGEQMVIDGRLAEVAWQSAQVNRGFIERTPNPGERAAVDSTVRVIYDEEALYIAIENQLMDGEQPVSMELRRDSFRIWSDDTITLKFDVLLDQLNTVGFAANAAGAQTDYLSLNNGRQFRLEYDAIWETSSTVQGNRWIMEFRIPYTALGLPANAEEQIIGFNVTRDHNRRAATYDLAHMPPEFGPTAATHYGRIRGIKGVGNRGRPLRVLPYARGMYLAEAGEKTVLEGGVGGDLRIRFGTDFWGEATVLTDFAEVDLDDALINLSRFPLFLPEKRAFFLSGLHIFEFGAPRQTQVFFSRRIGLDEDGETVPIVGGAKLYGNIGKVGLGGLFIVTEQTDAQPMASFGVARITHNLAGRGQIGAILVNRTALEKESELDPHFAGGLDASMRFMNDRLTLSSFAAWTAELGRQTLHDHSEHLSARYKGKNWQPAASIRRIGERFEPLIGFVRRTDVVSASVDSPIIQRWKTGIWNSLRVGPSGRVVGSADLGSYLESEGGFNASARTRNGDSVQTGLSYFDERLEEEFELLDDLVIQPGRFTGPTGYVGASSSRRRPLSGSINYAWNQAFYGGRRQSLSLGIAQTFGAHVRINLGGQASALNFKDRETDWTAALNSSLGLAWNTRLFLDTVIQANTIEETGRILSRLRWRYRPGSDLFIVYRQEFDAQEKLRTTTQQLNLKLTFWYDSAI